MKRYFFLSTALACLFTNTKVALASEVTITPQGSTSKRSGSLTSQ